MAAIFSGLLTEFDPKPTVGILNPRQARALYLRNRLCCRRARQSDEPRGCASKPVGQRRTPCPHEKATDFELQLAQLQKGIELCFHFL